VISGGLCDARSRSIPERVLAEAGQFLDLLIAAIGKSAKGALEARVRAEVRAGAFAAASPGDVEAIFDAWRRTLQVFAASQGRAVPEDRLLRILGRLESMAVDEARRWMDDRIDIIVVGASAGGIHTIQEMLGALREDLPATVVIVQHVSSKAPSLLPAVLGRSCDIKVVHAVEGARLFLGHVYVAPPAWHLVIREHRLHLSDAPPVRHVKPAADLLFDSAARLYGKHLASVVLSGSDHDGADGTRAVRDAGGMTIAQHPGSAQFPSMPESAIATGSVELVVSLPLLGDVLEKLVREGRTAVQERA
jgi:two-component system chemotaxis response regulator CheB